MYLIKNNPYCQLNMHPSPHSHGSTRNLQYTILKKNIPYVHDCTLEYKQQPQSIWLSFKIVLHKLMVLPKNFSLFHRSNKFMLSFKISTINSLFLHLQIILNLCLHVQLDFFNIHITTFRLEEKIVQNIISDKHVKCNDYVYANFV